MKKQKLRLSTKEWTLEEYEKIQQFREKSLDQSQPYGNIDAWENILQVCGMTTKEFDAMTPAEFLELTKKVSFEGVGKHQREIVVNEIKFSAFEKGEKFRVGIREAGAIERITKAKNGITYAEILACLLLRENETRETKLTTENINEKALILRDIKAVVAIPFLSSWLEACMLVLDSQKDETTE